MLPQSSVINGAEYQFHAGQNVIVLNCNMPCAICYDSSKAAMILVPATSVCPSSWTQENYGYLITEYKTHHKFSLARMGQGTPMVHYSTMWCLSCNGSSVLHSIMKKIKYSFVLCTLNNYCNHVAHASWVNHSYDIKSSFTTIESRKYAAPFLLHASIWQIGKGAYGHMGMQTRSLCCTFSGRLMEKATK